jgi:ribosome-binding factor A
MATRRQAKVARIVKEAVSDAIANHLGDPRIEGFVSVTRVDMAPDLRSADVYLSIFEKDPVGGEEGQRQGQGSAGERSKTFAAINHARTRIQSLLAGKVQSKFCPVLHFHMDDKFKKTLETMRLIEKAVSEFEDDEAADEGPG